MDKMSLIWYIKFNIITETFILDDLVSLNPSNWFKAYEPK